MIIKFTTKFTQNPLNLMRKIGYMPWRDPRSKTNSFIRHLGAAYYPRFHAYPKIDQQGNFMIDLHFDWRRPMHKIGIKSTEGQESEVVQKEVTRIKSVLGQ